MFDQQILAKCIRFTATTRIIDTTVKLTNSISARALKYNSSSFSSMFTNPSWASFLTTHFMPMKCVSTNVYVCVCAQIK